MIPDFVTFYLGYVVLMVNYLRRLMIAAHFSPVTFLILKLYNLQGVQSWMLKGNVAGL